MSVQGEMKRNDETANPTDFDEMSRKIYVCRSLKEGCCGLL